MAEAPSHELKLLDEPVYPQVLPAAPDHEPLQTVLERTGYKAALAPQYEEGHAPDAQRREGQIVPANPDYYGFPAIKKPEWKWYIPAYFLTGGVASGSYIVSALADLTGREEDRAVVRAGRYLCLVMMGASPMLLIADLGRQERWHHMLRTFRPRSMMNQGAWGLALFGAIMGPVVLAQIIDDLRGSGVQGVRRSGVPPYGGMRERRGLSRSLLVRMLSVLGIPAAAYVGSYTGVLLSATNVPLWAGSSPYLGSLFFASALSSGIAGTHLTAKMIGPVSHETEERLHSAETAALTTEAALTAAATAKLGKLSKPLTTGKMSTAFKVGYLALGVAAPLILNRLGKKKPWLGMLSSALSLAGTAVLKYAMTEAGKESADDPQAYFEYTKAEE